jgi:predicted membrane protein
MTPLNRRAFLGLFLVIIGLLLFLERQEIVFFPWWVTTWQMLLIGIGLFNLAVGNRTPAIILIGIGGFFLLEEMYYFDFEDYWPLILVIIGLAFIFRQRSASKGNVSDDDYFDSLNIFGGGNQKFVSEKLQGGRITSIFGGSEVDLRESKPVDGATIDIFTLFGGSDIIVPRDWNVKIEVSAILGGFADNRENVQQQSDAPKVVIKGLTLLGGGDLKNSK